MNGPNPILFALYRRAICLYPVRLRLRYRDQMLQTARDAHAEQVDRFLFWPRLFTDLFQSSVKEHLLMTRDQAFRRPIFFHAIVLGLILTLMGGSAAVTMQQMLRRGANHPQIEMGRRLAQAIAAGTKPEDLLPAGGIDLQTSLEPFAIFYSEKRVPIASTGFLNNAVPVPPGGVFDYAGKYQLDMITWQPQPGVRMASILRRVEGSNPGFILTGRSLLLVEEQEYALRRGTFITWFILMVLLAIGALFLNRAQTPRAIAA
ncbi:MAG: hypothetical protein M3O31_03985 [Acidobacteriota bacterium]|nr:hypothetical protein [Acidobacteriota bacterium]